MTVLRFAALGMLLAAPATEARVPSGPLAATMTAAAKSFLSTLDTGELQQTTIAFNSAERLNWSYVPHSRRGLPLARMRPATRAAATQLLRVALSEPGARKVDTIVSLEDVLRAVEGWSGRDSGLYYLSIFGEPAERGAWGWRFEGHHVSLNWTILDGEIVGSSPQFLGANPAEVRSGSMGGTRALAAEEDLARAVLASLSPAQRSRAVIAAAAPADIITGSARQASILERRGLEWAALDAKSQGLLLSLLQEYAGLQAPAVAEAKLAKIKAELASVVFAWMGGANPGQGHYYRVQGASFLVEYDNTQNVANHIHCVWREFHRDWGEDALAEHYRTAAHHSLTAPVLPSSHRAQLGAVPDSRCSGGRRCRR